MAALLVANVRLAFAGGNTEVVMMTTDMAAELLRCIGNRRSVVAVRVYERVSTDAASLLDVVRLVGLRHVRLANVRRIVVDEAIRVKLE